MCQQCEINPVYEFTNKRKLCARCFRKWFRKKFLYTIRKFLMLKKGEVVCLDSRSKDFRNIVLSDMLDFFVEKAPVEFFKNKSKKCTKIASSETSDLISYEFVSNIFESKDTKKLGPVEDKVIRPLYLFLDKEVLLYGRLRKLKFNKVKKSNNKLESFIDNLEEKHPELKQAIVKSYLELFSQPANP
jgi:hypothetical protein